jgi:hypothetical protein
VENARKAAFKDEISAVLRETGRGAVVSKAELVDAVRSRRPELFDDEEPCYPGCKTKHAKWQHEFDRSIYDLRMTIPRRLESGAKRGTYRLA